MQEQDEDLVQIIRDLQEAKGRGEVFDPRRLLEKIEVIGPSIQLSALRSNICAEVVDRVGVSWDEMFGRLLLFRGTHGHCRVPLAYKDKKLGKWVQHQRSFANKGTLLPFRKRRLDNIGFNWDLHETDWEEGFRYLTMYKEREGDCLAPVDHKENGFRLGGWIRTQRRNADTMSTSRRERLDELGFVWDPPHEAGWEEGVRYLKMYKEREGHCSVPRAHKENGFSLGQWVGKQRHRKTLPEARRQQLDELGFVWDPHETDWAEGLRYLTIYKEREGHCRVPARHLENGFRLGQWVGVQRGNADTLSAPRRKQLDELGFVWDPVETDWAEGLRYLTIYKEREGHCRVPATHKENGFSLGQWVRTQRGNADTLSAPRREQLDELGFVWDPHETDWAEGLRYLTIYKEREGHCRVPRSHEENGFRLGQWVSRHDIGRYLGHGGSDSMRLDLFGTRSKRIERRASAIYKEREGHCRVPRSQEENGFRLGQWVTKKHKKSRCL
jgi:helicase associated protein